MGGYAERAVLARGVVTRVKIIRFLRNSSGEWHSGTEIVEGAGTKHSFDYMIASYVDLGLVEKRRVTRAHSSGGWGLWEYRWTGKWEAPATPVIAPGADNNEKNVRAVEKAGYVLGSDVMLIDVPKEVLHVPHETVRKVETVELGPAAAKVYERAAQAHAPGVHTIYPLPLCSSCAQERLVIEDGMIKCRRCGDEREYEGEYDVKTPAAPVRPPVGIDNLSAAIDALNKEKEAVLAEAMEAQRVLDACEERRQKLHKDIVALTRAAEILIDRGMQ